MKSTKLFLSFFCFALLFLNTQCDDDDEVESNCAGQGVVVDSGFFESSESDGFELINAEITGNCLTVDISSSGCDGNTWSLVLVDSGIITESNPEQRFLKLVFSNEEDCLAVIGQTRVFDLSAIQIEGSNSINLNFEEQEESLIYDY